LLKISAFFFTKHCVLLPFSRTQLCWYYRWEKLKFHYLVFQICKDDRLLFFGGICGWVLNILLRYSCNLKNYKSQLLHTNISMRNPAKNCEVYKQISGRKTSFAADFVNVISWDFPWLNSTFPIVRLWLSRMSVALVVETEHIIPPAYCVYAALNATKCLCLLIALMLHSKSLSVCVSLLRLCCTQDH
jgi:hypothetical protein